MKFMLREDLEMMTTMEMSFNDFVEKVIKTDGFMDESGIKTNFYLNRASFKNQYLYDYEYQPMVPYPLHRELDIELFTYIQEFGTRRRETGRALFRVTFETAGELEQLKTYLRFSATNTMIELNSQIDHLNFQEGTVHA